MELARHPFTVLAKRRLSKLAFDDVALGSHARVRAAIRAVIVWQAAPFPADLAMVEPDGSAHVVAEQMLFANGMAVR